MFVKYGRSKAFVFSDLRHGWAPVEREHYRQSLSKVCLQQFLYENGTQLCSYLVCGFVFDQGLGARKSFCWNAVTKSWLHANSKVLVLSGAVYLRRKSCEAGGPIFLVRTPNPRVWLSLTLTRGTLFLPSSQQILSPRIFHKFEMTRAKLLACSGH